MKVMVSASGQDINKGSTTSFTSQTFSIFFIQYEDNARNEDCYVCSRAIWKLDTIEDTCMGFTRIKYKGQREFIFSQWINSCSCFVSNLAAGQPSSIGQRL